MAVIRWEPFRELASLQNEVNRLFNSAFDTPAGGSDAGARRWVPAMDLVETDEHFVLRADLPGLSQEDVTIEVEDGTLTVSGERRSSHEETKEGVVRVERGYGRFSRSLTLPPGIDPAGVTANFDRGVLEVSIPKPEARKPRRIEIATGNGKAEPATIEGSAS